MLGVSVLFTLAVASPRSPPTPDPCALHRQRAAEEGLLGDAERRFTSPQQMSRALLWLEDALSATCDVATTYTVAHRVAISLNYPHGGAALPDWPLEVILLVQRSWRNEFYAAPVGSWRRRHIALAQVQLVRRLLPHRWRYSLDTRTRIYTWASGWGPLPNEHGLWLRTLDTWLDEP